MAKKTKKDLALAPELPSGSIADYEEFVLKSLRAKQPTRNVLILGLVSEVGSVSSNIKKRLRDQAVEIIDKKDLVEEIGDVLWYLTAICCEYDLNLNNILLNNLKRIKRKPDDIISHLPNSCDLNLSHLKKFPLQNNIETFDEYEKFGLKAAGFINHNGNDILFQYCYVINMLSSSIFSIFHDYKEDDKPNEDLVKKLGDLFWYLSAIASHCKTSINEIVIHNKEKVKELFQTKILDLINQPLYDGHYKNDTEKLPRKMTVYFYNNDEGMAYIIINSIALGDPLNDNYEEDDGYRYHDGIHFVIYALLGWSPVWRSFLRKKRKSDKKIDNAQDGARAAIVEEMIVKMIHSFFEEISGGLDTISKNTKPIESVNFSFLKTIKLLTKGLEIESISSAQWEEIIIKSQEIYYKLRINDGGKLNIDLCERTIEYEPLDSCEEKYRFKKCD